METEVERLVVSLVGDLSSLSKAAEEADSVLEQAQLGNEDLKNKTEEVTQSSESMAEAVSAAGSVIVDINEQIAESTDKAAKATKFAEDVWNEFVKEVDAEIAAKEASAEQNKKLQETVDSLTKEFEEAKEGIERIKKAEEQLAKEEEELAVHNKKLSESFTSVVEGVKAVPGPAGGVVSGFQAMAGGVISFISASGPLIPIILAIAASLSAMIITFTAVKSTISTVIGEIERLGPSIDKATAMGESVGNIQALTFALEGMAGMTEQQVTSSLMNLQKVIGNTASQGGAAAEKFNKLGINLKELSGKAATEQFKEIAAAMAQVENHAERAALAQKMFGGQGKAILAALEAEADAIEKNEELARQLGITINDSQAAAIDNAGDSMALLSKITEGWIMQLSAGVAPLIQAISDWIFEWVPKAGGFSYVMKFVADTAADMLGYLLDASQLAMGIYQLAQGNVQAAYEALQSGLNRELSNELKRRLELAREASEVTKDQKQSVIEEVDEYEKLNEQAEKYALSLADQIAFLQQKDQLGGEKSKKIYDFMVQGADPKVIESLKYYQGILDDITKTENERKRAQSIVNQYKTSEEKVLESAKELKDFFDRGLIDETTFTRGMESLQKELDKNIEKANEFWRVMNGVDSEYVQGAEGIRAAVINKRVEGRMAIDPDMSEDRARFLTRGESSREGTDKKLISVLELLERHLRSNPDPNKLALKTVGSLEGVEEIP